MENRNKLTTQLIVFGIILVVSVLNIHLYLVNNLSIDKMESSMDLVFMGVQYCQANELVLDTFALNVKNQEVTVYCMECFSIDELREGRNITIDGKDYYNVGDIFQDLYCDPRPPFIVKRIDGEIYMTRGII